MIVEKLVDFGLRSAWPFRVGCIVARTHIEPNLLIVL